jgi:hypothetical protein
MSFISILPSKEARERDATEDFAKGEERCQCRCQRWKHKEGTGKCSGCVCAQFFAAGALPIVTSTPLPLSDKPLRQWTKCADCSREISCYLMRNGEYRCISCVQEWTAEIMSMSDPTVPDELIPVIGLQIVPTQKDLPAAGSEIDGNRVIQLPAAQPQQQQRQEAAFNPTAHIVFRMGGKTLPVLHRIIYEMDKSYNLCKFDEISNIERCSECNGFTWLRPNLTPHQVKQLAQQLGCKLKIDWWSNKCHGKTKWVPTVQLYEAMGGTWPGKRPWAEVNAAAEAAKTAGDGA